MTSRIDIWLCVACALAAGLAPNRAGAESAQPTTTESRPAPPPMSKEAIAQFLAQPVVAHLATVRANGTPQLVPMWFIYENGVMYMSTRTQAAKLRHLRRNPHVAVVVDVMEAPLKNKVVTIEGTAEVVTTGVVETTTKIYRKYMGADAATSPRAQQSIHTPRVILKITPKKVGSMDTTRG